MRVRQVLRDPRQFRGFLDRSYLFYKNHLVRHSKVNLMDMGGGAATAFVGSDNLTGFALLGLNGEAGVHLVTMRVRLNRAKAVFGRD
jgi:hypothetical protein